MQLITSTVTLKTSFTWYNATTSLNSTLVKPNHIPYHVSFRKYSNSNFRVFTVRDTKIIPAVKLSLELSYPKKNPSAQSTAFKKCAAIYVKILLNCFKCILYSFYDFLKTLEGSCYVLLELPSGVSQVQVIYHAALRPRILNGSFVRPLEGSFQDHERYSCNP